MKPTVVERIKNQWKNARDAKYCEIKLDIIYRNVETK